MPAFSPALLERLVAILGEKGASLTSREVACEILGIANADEALAMRLVASLVAGDPRVAHTGEGWSLKNGDRDNSPSLRAPHMAVFAPTHVDVVAFHRASPSPLALCVAVGGQEEIDRARTLGCAVEGAAISLGEAARLLRGYSGPATPDTLAHALGAERIEDASDAPAMARLVAAAFEGLVDELELEGVTTLAGLEALLGQALGAADLSGRAFSHAELEALDEGPGVYVFRDSAGAPLYVGQSLCLRARVGSYFCGPPRDEKDRAIRERAHTLEVESCDSAPDALIREAKLIERLAPSLNTQRQVARPAEESGVLVARDPRHEERAVLFALESGRLVARGVARGQGARASATVDRVLEAWREARDGPARGDEEAARLIATWRAARPGEPFFQRALTGDDDAIRAAILEALKEGTG